MKHTTVKGSVFLLVGAVWAALCAAVTDMSSDIGGAQDRTYPLGSARISQTPVLESDFEDSENASWDGWSHYTVVGSQEWSIGDTYGVVGPHFAKMTGYQGGALTNHDWLISPPIDLSEISFATLEFYNAFNYSGPSLKAKISTTYTGSGDPTLSTWEDITSLAMWDSDSATYVWTHSGTIDISEHDGQTIWIAFQYFSTSTHASLWEIDGVVVRGVKSSGDDPNIVLDERVDFGKIEPWQTSTQQFSIGNSGTSQVLHVTAILPVSGDTRYFAIGEVPGIVAVQSFVNVDVVYDPAGESNAHHTAIYAVVCSDPGEPTNTITMTGATKGYVSISNVQFTARDVSPYRGETVQLQGITTYTDPYRYAIADAGGGPWSGIYIFDRIHRPELGDEIRLEGTVEEYQGMTAIEDVTSYEVVSRGNPIPQTVVTAEDASAEMYESVLVTIERVVVSDANVGRGGREWQVSDGGTILVGDVCPYRYVWQVGDTLDAIRGLVWYSLGRWLLQPRFDDDFVGRPRVAHWAIQGLVMTPDGPKADWWVEIEDDDIVGVSARQPSGAFLLSYKDGIIFPGLMDIHNHPSWNSFPTLMLNNYPYGNRDAWGNGDGEYSEWRDKRLLVRDHADVDEYVKGTVTKYAECLELMAGCVTIQGGVYSKEYSHPDVVLYNVNDFPSRVHSDVFAWGKNTGEVADLKARINGGAVNAVLIHLCEGPDATSHAQFSKWRDEFGLLNETTAIIHGTSLTAADFTQMAAAGAKLVWSPMSNMRLYGATANVVAAKKAGVLIGLSPDWTPSGCYNLLEELGFAWYLNTTQFREIFTAKDMVDMVTINNSTCVGLQHRYGKIAVGYNAGLCVIAGDWRDPYMALIHARPKDVKLTVVDGTPRYGDQAILSRMGLPTTDSVTVHGVEKAFNIAVAHPFLDYATETFGDLRTHLRTAHATLNAENELDSEELQFLDMPLLQAGPDNVGNFAADSPISTAPPAGLYDVGDPLSIVFRYQDFWDNETVLTNLVHERVGIVPVAYPEHFVQIIAAELPNRPGNETITFDIDFMDMHTNYAFRFDTRDRHGNVRSKVDTKAVFDVVPYAGGDTDGDGIDNEWEMRYSRSPVALNWGDRTDADSFSDGEEYVADTDPTREDSYFHITAMTTDGGRPSVTFVSSTACVYSLYVSTNLLDRNGWTVVKTRQRGNENQTTLKDESPGGTRFYRVSVRRP